MYLKHLCLLCLAVLATTAKAATLNYTFDVTLETGPLAGQVLSGQFTIADGLAPSDGDVLVDTELLEALTFTFDEVIYDTHNADSGALDFDAQGNYSVLTFGNNCADGGCQFVLGMDHWAASIRFSGLGTFMYTSSDAFGVFFGTIETTFVPSPVPLPAAGGLFAAGLIGLCSLASRRRFNAPQHPDNTARHCRRAGATS